MWLGGLYSRYGSFEKEKISCLFWDSNPGLSSRSVAMTSASLSRLPQLTPVEDLFPKSN
jgi:hypothetical protein